MMDTSKEYILMCKKAPRELWLERFGATVFYNDKLMYVVRYEIWDVIGETKLMIVEDGTKESNFLPTFHEVKTKDIIPAYRQDQLQEMVMPSTDWGWRSYGKTVMSEFLWQADFFKFDYMEQLWLAFVMKKKFNKTWDGKDWCL